MEKSGMLPSNDDIIIEVKGIKKSYPGVMALKGVDFCVKRNTVHCIVGENGAGKSTFIKVLSGIERRNGGEIFYNGQTFNPKNAKETMDSGMSMLFQELNIIDGLTVEENLTLGKEKKLLGIIRRDKDEDKLLKTLKLMAPDIRMDIKVGELSVAKKQIIEIAKAVASNADVIIMDEPTAAISEDEVHKLFSIIKELKQNNVTVVYISHRLNEIFEIGDYVSVFRDGNVIDTKAVCEIESRNELIKMMTGRIVAESFVPSKPDKSVNVIDVKSAKTNKLKNISFVLHKGEILGFYGLIDSGKTEVARMLYGIDSMENGEVFLNGNPFVPYSPKHAIQAGISLLPEERRTEGLCTMLSVKSNIPLMNMKNITGRLPVIQKGKEEKLACDYIERISIRCHSSEQLVALLSGGNQQKVVLSKCLNSASQIILLDEPTRGVDVGAKGEIHDIIRKLVRQGNSVIVFSSDLPEILNLCDRILLLYDGEIKGELENGVDVSSENIMKIVTGGGQ